MSWQVVEIQMRSLEISESMSSKLANMGFICSLMVVMNHIGGSSVVGSGGWYLLNISTQICKIAVPFFFLASGFFLMGHVADKNWYKRAIPSRLKSLGIPYLAWSIIWALYFVSVCCRHGGWISFLKKHMISIVGLDLLNWPFYTVLWFLRALFIFILISPIFLVLVKRLKWKVVILFWLCDCLFRFCFPQIPQGVSGFFKNVISLEGCAYFILGIGLRVGCLEQIPFLKCLTKWSILVFPVIVFLSVIYCKGNVEDLALEGFIIPFVMLFVWQICPINGFPRFLIKSSFPIYLIHLMVIAVLSAFICKDMNSILMILTKYCIVVALSMVIGLMIRRMSTKFAWILFGGR